MASQVLIIMSVCAPLVLSVLFVIKKNRDRRKLINDIKDRFSEIEDKVYSIEVEIEEQKHKEGKAEQYERPIFSGPMDPRRNRWRRE